jgi:hypothetical protein
MEFIQKKFKLNDGVFTKKNSNLKMEFLQKN